MALKLMVVDDDPEVLKLIRSVVIPLGYEALTVTDSREAGRRVRREKFDGVVLSAEMPHLDGYALVRHIRCSPSNNTVPIAMLTEDKEIEAMRAGFRAGVTFFLGKPLVEKKLRGLLVAMHGPMLREKRRRVRLPVQIPVQGEAGMRHFKSTSLNISERGMLLELPGDVPVGEELHLSFVLPQAASPIELRAKVVRKEPPNCVAVQFVEIQPKAHRALRDFIAGIVQG